MTEAMSPIGMEELSVLHWHSNSHAGRRPRSSGERDLAFCRPPGRKAALSQLPSRHQPTPCSDKDASGAGISTEGRTDVDGLLELQVLRHVDSARDACTEDRAKEAAVQHAVHDGPANDQE